MYIRIFPLVVCWSHPSRRGRTNCTSIRTFSLFCSFFLKQASHISFNNTISYLQQNSSQILLRLFHKLERARLCEIHISFIYCYFIVISLKKKMRILPPGQPKVEICAVSLLKFLLCFCLSLLCG